MTIEPQSRAIAIPVENLRTWFIGVFAGFSQPVASAMERAAEWAGETAQNFGALVSALMGPAVLCAYAIALWSLSASFGWTDTFLFTSGALSNWLIWLALAILIHVAASVLRRRIEE
ncbi:MAG TPA: hypothetical protein VGK64_00020 [Bryobacteraceae bacterium]